ncbi:hypothetical protein EPD60_12670 [Flaviaesturariibacter flavus]|uniref:Uncharacterized protein n=1 Tax=Flaviaesturariibacter flavus TaxID=2502780 RepID=A0A4R1B539_9BACT|nr:hypothetical protein [Flaviaesturariibacter flavus]TCJ13244.1 hypothetical protein EPD60_12670 [Flaviaesturariibacter flavus]
MSNQPNEARIEQDLNELIQYLVGFCADLIEKYGEFFPVGAYLDVSGGLVPLGVYEGNEQPESAAVIAQYQKVFGKLVAQGSATAWAIAWDARVTGENYPEGTDAVVLDTWHGLAKRQVQYTFPYHLEEGIATFPDNWWGVYTDEENIQ